MENLLNHAAEFLSETLREDLGEPILYDAIPVRIQTVGVASKPEELVDAPAGEGRLGHDDLDWMLVAAELSHGGHPFLPKPGHRITRLRHGPEAVEVYEACEDEHRKCWQRADPAGTLLTIHTRRIK
jgi:hypothetical protein